MPQADRGAINVKVEKMRIVIIGSVAGGTSAAAKARRNSEEHEIVIYDMDRIFHTPAADSLIILVRIISQEMTLTPRNSAWFKKRFNIDIFTEHMVTDIDPEE